MFIAMTRHYKRKPGSRRYRDYTEASLRSALQDIRSKTLSINEASKKYGISRGTLQRKARGIYKNPHGGQTVLSKDTEKDLVKLILTCANWGYPMSIMSTLDCL